MPYEKMLGYPGEKLGANDDLPIGKEQSSSSNKQIELSFLNAVAADFYRLLHLDEDLNQKPIDIQVTSDGLRVTLFDRAKRPLFSCRAQTEFTELGRIRACKTWHWLIHKRHLFFVTIEQPHRTRPSCSSTRTTRLGSAQPTERTRPRRLLVSLCPSIPIRSSG